MRLFGLKMFEQILFALYESLYCYYIYLLSYIFKLKFEFDQLK